MRSRIYWTCFYHCSRVSPVRRRLRSVPRLRSSSGSRCSRLGRGRILTYRTNGLTVSFTVCFDIYLAWLPLLLHSDDPINVPFLFLGILNSFLHCVSPIPLFLEESEPSAAGQKLWTIFPSYSFSDGSASPHSPVRYPRPHHLSRRRSVNPGCERLPLSLLVLHQPTPSPPFPTPTVHG